ncbi:MAG TPA: hypothetical protein VJ901_06970 [Thermoanaerobaculia bacterium]|nr:hypothetical protein [Thermoanaerobaculia bacterium]
MNVLRILPLAMALFAAPAVIPSVVEGPGCVVARMTSRAATAEVEYDEPRIPREAPLVAHEILAAPIIPLRGAATPRAPAV